MARPPKLTVDYFSHDANSSTGRTLTILFNYYGHEGLSAWWQLLENISSTNNHVIDIRNSESFEYLAAKLHFQPEKLKEILNKLSSLGAIDEQLYKQGFIWSQNFIDRLAHVYKSRGQDPPERPSVAMPDNSVSSTDNSVSSTGNTTKIDTIDTIDIKEIYKEKGDNGFILPDWIDVGLWTDFMEVRKKLRAVPTLKAKQLLVKDLENFRAGGDDPNKVIEKSIKNAWKGLFPLKGDGRKDGQHGRDTKAFKSPARYTRPEEL